MKKIVEVLSAAGGAVIAYLTGLPPILWILVCVMTLDYITGLACGWMGVSPKTEGGGLSSQAAFKGLMKKVLILCVVALAALIDRAVSNGSGVDIAAVEGATCFWFIASEGLSVLENAAAMGIPIPKALLRALEIVKSKGEGQEPQRKSALPQLEDVDEIDLESMPYESLVIFALDNGLGFPGENELHGQNKEEIRQAMLDWLEERLSHPPEVPPAE